MWIDNLVSIVITFVIIGAGLLILSLVLIRTLRALVSAFLKNDKDVQP